MAWYAWQDSNLRPFAPEQSGLFAILYMRSYSFRPLHQFREPAFAQRQNPFSCSYIRSKMVLLQFRYVSHDLEQGYGAAAILDHLRCASLPPTLRASQCACDLQPPWRTDTHP